MQNGTASSFAEAFLEHRDEFGVEITFAATTITATVSESQFGRDLMEGGFADDGDIEVKFLLSDLESIPSIGSSVTYRDRAFKVSRLGIQPGALVGEVTCRPAKR